MIKEIMHDPVFLALQSELATAEDLQVARDLMDTLETLKRWIAESDRIVFFGGAGVSTELVT